MVYYCKKDLDTLRRSKTNKNGDLKLYALFGHLSSTVITITKLTKQYVYDENDIQYRYPSKSSGYEIYDNRISAWKRFKELLEIREKGIYDRFNHEMKQLTKTKSILKQCADETPEYFM